MTAATYAGRCRIGQAVRQVQQALALVVEGTLDEQRLRILKSEAAGEVTEVLAHRQASRR